MGIIKLYTSASEFSNIPEENITASSEMPMYINMGNLVFEKQYNAAIQMGEDLLKACPQEDHEYLSMIHINLMQAYFKSKDINPNHLELSTYHAKQSMLYGHNTGYAQERLIINLEKSNKIYQAIQVCEIILSEDFSFGNNTRNSKDDFLKRREKLFKKIHNSADSPESKIFNGYELNVLYKINDEKNRCIPEILRAQRNDIYICYEIHLSNHCNEACSICGKLAGKYPKNFKWTKWHDGCKCFASAEMKSREDFNAYLKSSIKIGNNEGTVKILPKQFMTWYKGNYQQPQDLNNAPDFIRNNIKLIIQSEDYYKLLSR